MALRRTRVLMVVDTLAMGGAERVAVDVANSLDRDRYEVSFCATRADGPLHDVLAADVPVRVLGRTATWDVRKLAAFAALVRHERIDIVHSHGRGTMRLVALCRAGGTIRSTHVFHDHFASLHTQRGANVFLRNALRLGVDTYIGVDSRLCTWARTTAGVPADRVNLVRSGVDVSRFEAVEPLDLHEHLGLAADDLAMVMVANFRPQKDHPTLFRAMAELPPGQRERLQLVVVGSTDADQSYFDSCMAMADHLGLTDQIHLLGARDDAPQLLAGADAAVISSKNETGPLVILEYMASGLPFVATETGEIARAVKGQGCGIVPAPRDHRALAAALATLLEMSPEERAAMGRQGRRVIAEQFDQRVVSRQIERLYEQALGVASPV